MPRQSDSPIDCGKVTKRRMTWPEAWGQGEGAEGLTREAQRGEREERQQRT